MPPVVPAFTAPVSTVGEVTSSDTTAVPAEPSAVSQDRVCALKMTMVGVSNSFRSYPSRPIFI